MIDFVKLQWDRKEQVETLILDSDIFKNVRKSVDIKTGEEVYPLKGELLNLNIDVTTKKGYLRNSLHRMHNILKYEEDQNYNDFTRTQLIETVDYIESNIPCVNNAKITQLEYGLNIQTLNPACEIIRNNVLMHKHNGYSHNRQFRGHGEYLQFNYDDYLLKLYDKAMQFGIDQNTMRLEMRIWRRRNLESLGIFCLNDLIKTEVLKNLYEHFKKRINELILVDSICDSDSMKNEDNHLFNLYRNPKYWSVDLNSVSRATKQRRKVDFERLITEYNMNTSKQSILDLIDSKFAYLLNN